MLDMKKVTIVKESLFLFCLLLIIATVPARAAVRSIDPVEFGAQGDGKTLCTKAIQKAIDKCADAGGGTVALRPGTWLSGTLYMKDNVTLWLDAGCTLLGSGKFEDYPRNLPAIRSYTDRYVDRSLIAGEGLKNIAIRGRGTIDGNGGAYKTKKYLVRPYVIRLVDCQDVLIEGIRLERSPMWMQHYLACKRVTLRGITVYNHKAANADGVDIDGCSDVVISDCNFDTDDDAITLKSTLDRPCENVVITNCIASSHCNAIKAGTESHGGFKNITISNCTICSPRHTKVIYGKQRGLAGIALEIVDGGHLDRVAIDNIVIRGVTTPIFLRLGNRARLFKEGIPKPGVGTFRNVSISNIVATDCSPMGCAISGLRGHPIENVSLSNIQLTFEGGGTAEQAVRPIPEQERKYPECTMFGPLSAYGFFCRHVDGLTLSNVRLRTDTPDARPAVVCGDVARLDISGLDASFSPDTPMLRFDGVRDALVRGCQPRTAGKVFLKVEGSVSRDIAVVGNDLRRVKKPVEKAADAPAGAVFIK